MVVPEERDGKLEEDPNLGRDATPANVTTSTRSGGKKQTLTRKVNMWSAVGNFFLRCLHLIFFRWVHFVLYLLPQIFQFEPLVMFSLRTVQVCV